MATATAPRKTLTSPRFPGWEIERVARDSWFMSRPGHIFAIGIGLDGFGAWSDTLLTRQRGEWRLAYTPFDHCVIGCVAEANRREKAIAKCKAKGARR